MTVKARSKKGFGLVETLLVIALFALVMVVVADLVTSYRDLVRQSQGRSRTLKGTQIAVAQIRSDIRAAVEVLTPSTGESQVLELQRLNSSLTPRLPSVVATTPPSSWNILDPAHQYRIDYRLKDDLLIRTVDGNELVLASGLSDFKVSVDGAQYEILLQVKERARDMNLLSRVSRP